MTGKTHSISEQEVEKIKRLLNGKLPIDEINTELKEVNALLEEIKTRQDPVESGILAQRWTLLLRYLNQEISKSPYAAWTPGYQTIVNEMTRINAPGGIERMKKKLEEGKS